MSYAVVLLVIQGISLIASLSSKPKADISTLALFEIIQQLQNLNEGLTQLNSTMVEAVRLLGELPADLAIFNEQYQTLVASERFSDVLRQIDPGVGNIENLADVHKEISKSYFDLRDAFNKIESLTAFIQDKPLSLLPLSFPIIKLIHDLIRSAEFSFLPDLIYIYANKEAIQVKHEVNFGAGIEINTFIATLNDITDFLANDILGPGGAYGRFETQLAKELSRFAVRKGADTFRRPEKQEEIIYTIDTAGMRGADGAALVAIINVYKTIIVNCTVSTNLSSLNVVYTEGITHNDERPRLKWDQDRALEVYWKLPHPTVPIIENKQRELGPKMKGDDPWKPFKDYLDAKLPTDISAIRIEDARYAPFGPTKISFDDRATSTVELVQVGIFMRNFHDLLELIVADIRRKLDQL